MGGKGWIGASRLAAAALGLAILVGSAAVGCASEPRLDEVRLPEGFSIEVWAEVPNARSLALGSRGTVFVGARKGGTVYAVEDVGGRRTVRVLAKGLDRPNGVAFRDGDLYVAEVTRILRFKDIEAHLAAPPPFEVAVDGFPQQDDHGWKYVAFGPDGLLYVPIGTPCNICERRDPFGTIMRVDVRTGRKEIFAKGIRNTVGFDWRPTDKVLWFTNNGRDWLGDDRPPDSLHAAPRQGMDFGFPFCNAGEPDQEYGKGRGCSGFDAPVLLLPAHVAPLGMKFYTGAMFPEPYRGHIFIAEHGSWNRSTPVGYRISLARFKPGGGMAYEVFAWGWLQGGRAWGRPVDVLVMADGALLVSDDKAGLIYRIAYGRGGPGR